MHSVSKKYKSSMKELLRERSYMMVSFGLFNQEAMANADIGGTDFTYYSKNTNIFGRTLDGTTYATLENDFTKVDGSMFFLPRERTGTYYDTGLIGNPIMDGGYYDLTISLNVIATDIKGLTVNFGEIYPVDFDISTSSGKILEIRGNDNAEFVTEEVFEDTTYIKFRFYSMSNPGTRLRIYTILLGFGLVYYNNDITDSSLISYVSPICADMTQIDFTVKLQNYNQYFNVDNPDSAINFLETGQEMYVWYGYNTPEADKIEWFQAAKLFCSEWESDDSSVTIKCNDRFRSMDDEYYKGDYNPSGVSLYDLAVMVFQDAEIEEYYIDPYLKKLKTKNPLPRVTHREALQIIANAGRCILTQNATGIPQLESSFVPDYVFSCNGEATYSHIENIKNDDAKQEYAAYATNYSTVDGKMYTLPEDDSGGLYTGYISANQSDDDCLFDTNPVITVTQESECKYYGFNIRFGSALPAEFKVVTYNNGSYVEEFTYGGNIISREMSVIDEFQNFDVMKIEFIKTKEPHSRIVIDHFGFGSMTEFTMERQDMTSSPKSIKQELVKRVDVSCYSYTKGRTEIETVISEETTASAGDEVIYYFDDAYSGYIATFNGLASNVKILASGAYYIKVSFSISGTATFEVSAYRYIITEQYASNQLNNRGKIVSWQNPLIGNMEIAKDVAEWVGEYYKSGIEYEYDSRGNPEIEANDIIYQENAYCENMKVRVYRHTVNFNGTLSGKVEARRITDE